MRSYEEEVSLCDFDASFFDVFLDHFSYFFNQFSQPEFSCFMFVLNGKIAGYKKKLFANLAGKAETLLEIGVGTGPNLKYYAGNENICVFGMDPNHKMEKYACESAKEAGMKPENVRFMQGVSVTDLFSCERSPFIIP